MLEECLNRENVPLGEVDLSQVTFTFQFLPSASRKCDSLTFDVAWPNACGLRNQRPERVELALKYLKRWKVDRGQTAAHTAEATGVQPAASIEG